MKYNNKRRYPIISLLISCLVLAANFTAVFADQYDPWYHVVTSMTRGITC